MTKGQIIKVNPRGGDYESVVRDADGNTYKMYSILYPAYRHGYLMFRANTDKVITYVEAIVLKGVKS